MEKAGRAMEKKKGCEIKGAGHCVGIQYVIESGREQVAEESVVRRSKSM